MEHSHRTLSLQNECFVRDFLQKSRIKSAKQALRTTKSHTSMSPKRAFRTRLPPKVKQEAPSEHTHIKQPCQAVSRFQPHQTTRSHPNPNVKDIVTLTSTTTHNLTGQSTAPATKSALPHVKTRKKTLRLPRKVTILYHVD